MKETKVLVVSHTVFSESGNMGRTMADFFSAFPCDLLAQIYFHSEVPTLDICHRYFRVTDRNVLKSVFTRRAGYRIFNENDIDKGRKTSRTDKGIVAKIYQFSRRRTPIIYILRNLMWRTGVWDSKAMNSWLDKVNPDVIFFAAGDYSFSYRVVERISKKRGIPVVMWFCDDHFLNLRDNPSFLECFVKKDLIKWAKKVAQLSCGMIAISDKMKDDYSKLFNQDIEVLRISAKVNSSLVPSERRTGVVYAGNLGVQRLDSLIELGKTLKNAGIPGYDHIDVYSGERDPNRLALLKEENGIIFHGAVPQGELARVLQSARYLLHVESKDPEAIRRTRYSLSTKIGESLVCHGVIFAYGPKEISSMTYLSDHHAAVMLESASDLIDKINYYNEHHDEYQNIVSNALKLAESQHNKTLNDKLLYSMLTQAQEN